MTRKEPGARPGSYGQLHSRIARILAALSPTGPARFRPRSVAVLPMADLSREKDQEYFCDGITEELTNALAKFEGLSVASRTSAFQFKNTTCDIGEIGRRLNVDTVLEGSVRKEENTLRITAQLIDVATGYHVWSERFDREMSDVFAVQDEITASIVSALQVSLGAGKQDAIQKLHTRNVQAYDFYLRGRKYFWDQTGKSLEMACHMLRRAIEIDPEYALAHASLADSCSFMHMYVECRAEYLAEADTASAHALELAPSLAEAHISRGLAMDLAGREGESVRHFENAIQLSPALFDAHYLFGRACISQGKMERAARLFEQAQTLRPDSYLPGQMLRMVYERLGRHAEAEAVSRRTLALVEHALEFDPDDTRTLYTGANIAAFVGDKHLSLTWAQRILAPGRSDPAVLYNVACVYSLLGEIKDAIDLLRSAVDAGFAHRSWMENDTDLDPLRSQTEFQNILESIPD